MNPGDFPPDDFTWADLVGNREMVRDVLRFVEQMKSLEVLVACEKRVLKLSEHAENMVLDLRVELPPAPVLTVTEADPVLTLTWVFEETGYTGVYVERSLDGITFTPLANLTGDATTYDDENVEVEVEYCYRVKGKRCGIYSLYSNIDCGTLIEEEEPTALALRGAGYNFDYQLGDGTTTTRTSFVTLDSGALCQRVAGTAYGSQILKSDGTIWGCGLNGRGQIGDGTFDEPKTTFVQGVSGSDWTDLTHGRIFYIASKANGERWGWGDNGWGQMGLGDDQDRESPTQLSGTDWALLRCGYYHTLGIKNDGTLWTTGKNDYGQLGHNDTTQRTTFTQVGSGTDWAFCFGGELHSFGIKTDGTLWAWGLNNRGQLGRGNTTDSLVPVQIGSDTDWASGAAGQEFSIAIKTTGTMWATGRNLSGQLAQGDTTQRESFTQIGSATDWKRVECGELHALAMKTVAGTQGALYGWGYNGDGGLGLGDTSDRNVVTQVGTDTDWLEFSPGEFHSLATKGS